MKVFSQLVQAQLENRTSDYSQGTYGLCWLRTDTNAFKFDDGVSIQTVRKVSDTIPETGGGTNQTTYTTGDILYASGANTLSKRAIGSAGTFLKVVGGVPTWASITGTLSVVTKTHSNSPYTVSATDDIVLLDTTTGGAGAITANLPAATGSGKVYYFKKIDSGTGVIQITPNGSDTIDGTTAYNIPVQYQAVTMVDGVSGKWYVL